MRQKRMNYIFDPLDFFIDLNKILIPRAHETLCKSLAPFRIISWVDSVQRIINRCHGGEFN